MVGEELKEAERLVRVMADKYLETRTGATAVIALGEEQASLLFRAIYCYVERQKEQEN